MKKRSRGFSDFYEFRVLSLSQLMIYVGGHPDLANITAPFEMAALTQACSQVHVTKAPNQSNANNNALTRDNCSVVWSAFCISVSVICRSRRPPYRHLEIKSAAQSQSR